ncbi:hypothetical protein V5O48_017009 [Marasmius crinis-equi]|uniref:Uncharacterized protein n=1 Tax=Marasmius crinis-equi TaxID=585013 RepID=A0ABR3EQ70_9AGAR
MQLFQRAFTLSSSSFTPSTDHTHSATSRPTHKRKSSATHSTQSESDSSSPSKPSKRSRFSSIFNFGSFDFSIGETKPSSTSAPIPVPSAPKGLKPYKPRSSPTSMGGIPKSPPTCTISLENATANESRVLASLDVNVIPFPSTSTSPKSSSKTLECVPSGKHTRSRSNHVLLRRSPPRTHSSSKGHKRHRSCSSAAELVPAGYERPSTPLPSSLYEHDDDESCPRIELPSLVDDVIFSTSLLKKRADAKLVAMVRRSVVCGLRESAVAALKATAIPLSESESEPVDMCSKSFETTSTLVGSGSPDSGSGSVTYDFLNASEEDDVLERKAEIMEQDRILVHRFGKYLDDWGYRERRVPLTVPSFHSGSYTPFLDEESDKENSQSTFVSSLAGSDDLEDDDDPFLPMDIDHELDAMQVDSSSAGASTPSPPSLVRRSTPSPPPVIPAVRGERKLALDQLVATLTLKHRDRIGARKNRAYEPEQWTRTGTKLKIELC